MNAIDRWVASVGERLDALDKNAASAFFLASASALRGEYQLWAEHTRTSTAEIDDLIAIALALCFGGKLLGNEAAILNRLDRGVPDGENKDFFSSTSAQDCWICLDVSLRTLLADYSPGSGFWYCVEPVLQAETEALFGFTELGSEDLGGETELIFESEKLKVVREYCDFALELLDRGLNKINFSVLLDRAAVLRP